MHRSADLAALGGRPSVGELRGRGRVRGALPLLGPAFVAAIAYVDPGNFATNFTAGAQHGYQLLWVVVAANLVAMVVQDQSAKLGLATGRNLPELCREHCPRPVSWGLWLQAETVSVATDVAEVVGGAVALHLLFGLPLVHGALVTGAVAFGLLALQSRGYRVFELTVAGLFGVIVLGLLTTVLWARPRPGAAAEGLLPDLGGAGALPLAVGMLGATVMPHVIYLHSALTQRRVVARGTSERRHLLRHQRIDIAIGLGLAGVVNASMLLTAATLAGDHPVPGADPGLDDVHAALGAALGPAAALAFAVALLAAGLASSGVGTMAGQVVMAGFVRLAVPVVLRRSLTLVPAVALVAWGADPTLALVLSQVVLSFGIPFALVPLVLLTRRADLLGDLANRRPTTWLLGAVTVAVSALNAWLLVETLG